MFKKKISTQKALNLWAIILIVWSVYRANLKQPAWFDEFIAKPLVFIFPVYHYITRIEKRKFVEGIGLKIKNLKFDIPIGILIGSIFFLSAFLANWVKLGKIVVPPYFLKHGIKGLALIITLSLATGVSEEILSRGFVLKRLYQESKNIYTSSFFASILFFFLHIPILFTISNIGGNTILMIMVTDMILSLANSFIFFERGLALPILIHAFYNLTIILLF